MCMKGINLQLYDKLLVKSDHLFLRQEQGISVDLIESVYIIILLFD